MMDMIILLMVFLLPGQKCSDPKEQSVLGYKGAGVIIKWKYPLEYLDHTKYFCIHPNKLVKFLCHRELNSKDDNSWVRSGKYSLVDDKKAQILKVLITKLTQDDSKTYYLGLKKWFIDQKVNFDLTVHDDPCCGGLIERTAFLGGSVNITCKYSEMLSPGLSENIVKHFYKEDRHKYYHLISSLDRQQHSRFLISNNKQNGVFSVLITQLSSDDTGVYWCGTETHRESMSYISLTTEIQLNVEASSTTRRKTMLTTTLPTKEILLTQKTMLRMLTSQKAATRSTTVSSCQTKHEYVMTSQSLETETSANESLESRPESAAMSYNLRTVCAPVSGFLVGAALLLLWKSGICVNVLCNSTNGEEAIERNTNLEDAAHPGLGDAVGQLRKAPPDRSIYVLAQLPSSCSDDVTYTTLQVTASTVNRDQGQARTIDNSCVYSSVQFN